MHSEFFSEEDEWLPCTEEYFYKNKSSKQDGLHPYCKECSKEKSSQWQVNNDKKYRKYIRKRDSKESQERKEYKRKIARLQKASGYQQLYRKNNKDKMKKYNERREKYKKHQITNEEWEQCKKYFNYSCAYCGIPENEAKELYKNKLHREHVIDCGRNDLKNCIPACKQCNGEKNATSLNMWYNSNNLKYTYERYYKIYRWLKYDYKKYIKSKNEKKLKKVS